MKKTLIVSSWVVLAAVTILIGGTAHADVVYANSTNDLVTRFNPLLSEVGDEISLAGTYRTVTNFNLQYWGLNFDGDEALQVRFYQNNGPAAPAGPTILEPGTLLFDSGAFPIGATARSVLNFDYASLTAGNLVNLTAPVPDTFTWSVQFFNTNANASYSAGVDLYDPPTIGGNYNEYWENTGGGWEYRGTNSVNINFAARVEATPEPTVVALGLLGGLSVLLLRNRRQRR